MIDAILAGMREASGPVTHSSDVAEAIWQVANDPSHRYVPERVRMPRAWMKEAKMAS